MLEKMAVGGMEGLKKQFQTIKADASKQLPPELAESLLAVADELLTGTEIKREGAKLALTIKTPKGLEKLASGAGGMAKQMMQTGAKP